MTNVVAFGADVVGVGDRVKVTVLSVDLDRNRIGLSVKASPLGHRGPRS